MRTISSRRAIGVMLLGVLSLGIVFVAQGDVLDGTDRADVLIDPSGMDDTEIHGLAGDDTINLDNPAVANSDGDHDLVFAGPGADMIRTGPTDDDATIFGGNGDDTFQLADEDDDDGRAAGPILTVHGGRGDDLFTFQTTGNDGFNDASEFIDGPGADTIFYGTVGTVGFTIRLVPDNEQDTVRIDGDSSVVVIELSRGSGRDVIDCGGGGTVFLNGNRKAVDNTGNNLREAALLGGTAESNCDRIVP